MRRRKPSCRLKPLCALLVMALIPPLGADAGLERTTGDTTPLTAAEPLPQVMRVAEAEPAAQAEHKSYVWAAARSEQRIKVIGSVPSEEDRKTILGMIKANMPELEISDRMEVADGAPPRQLWLGAVSFALVQLGHLKTGSAKLDGTHFYVDGEARSAASYAALRKAVTSQLPSGIVLKQALLSPPLAKPFVWSATYEAGALTLSGNVPSDADREAIIKRVTELFHSVHIVDRMEIAAGAPDNWAGVATLSLTVLARLESGKISLSDTTLSVEGIANDKATAAAVASALKDGLPKGYEAKDSIRDRPQEKQGAIPLHGHHAPLLHTPLPYPA